MSFFVTGPSYVRPEFPNNKANSFKVRLPNRLPLEGSNWKVALVSISLPSNPLIASLLEEDDNEWLLKYSYRPQGRDLSSVTSLRYTNGVKIEDLKRGYHAGLVYDSLTFFDFLLDTLQNDITTSIGLNHEVKSSDRLTFTWKKEGHGPYLLVEQHEKLTGNAKLWFHKKLALLMK